jgi:hypothetical protein
MQRHATAVAGRVNRREFLRTAAMAGVGISLLLEACAAQAGPSIATPTSGPASIAKTGTTGNGAAIGKATLPT